MAVLNQFSELKPCMSENFNIPDHFSLQTPLMSHQQSEFPENYTQNNLLSNFHSADSLITANEDVFHENNQRQAREQSTSISQNISCSASTIEFEGDTDKRRKNRLGRGKKAKAMRKRRAKQRKLFMLEPKRTSY
ncbi:hypothetical protein LWI28_006026 [Acer negundo]|uniref:Uncharacterized protein n=1 Tax=Acer negundo TaxID=4023 RepID=A0AAD5NIQ1_ACENE|nr:hypothetical protein LWI28_006026 [Acer negundo]